jgi:hypothetical protein
MHSTKRGNSFNRNLGISQAKMTIIAFPDDDCFYDVDVIKKILEIFQTNEGIDGVSGNWLDTATNALVIGKKK